ncbi:GNAT family N-acetyltransferase [Actinomadura barringtoniae]|uniref:GNAT family N-acetyltransferase n=1 Tax=Actinomadura barringtoniae TaxID=1427535 RepID=A0A939PKA3_9ACTN|nr:GNAT family N-acetyltransferase [Actinomadura barringtoniae]MBO2451653.1 GNAT family N-acetyltransferase [Actinomadura barringtoniae]
MTYSITRHTSDEAIAMEGELTELYVKTYAEPPYNGGGVYTEDGFHTRNQRQFRSPGFSLITARSSEGDLVGFAFGFTMGPGRWWGGATEPDGPVMGQDKFALIELVVDAAHRGQGLGRRMHDEILANRPERYSTLCAHPGAQPARDAYDRWGWVKAGTVGLADDQADVMVLDLKKDGRQPVEIA